eukprot:123222-Prymnesium_polylepis.1
MRTWWAEDGGCEARSATVSAQRARRASRPTSIVLERAGLAVSTPTQAECGRDRAHGAGDRLHAPGWCKEAWHCARALLCTRQVRVHCVKEPSLHGSAADAPLGQYAPASHGLHCVAPMPS